MVPAVSAATPSVRNRWAASAAPGCCAPMDINCSDPIVTTSTGGEAKMGRVFKTVSAPSGDKEGPSLLSEAEVLDAKLPTLTRRICSSLEKHVEDAERAEFLRPADPGAWIVRGGEDGSGP